MGLAFELDAGVKMEVVTKDDLEKALRNSRVKRETIWEGASGATDSSGNLSLPILDIPIGKLLVLERLILWADGFDPDTVSTTGWFGLYHGRGQNPGQLADFSPQSSGAQVFPSLAEYNHNNAPRFKGGETMVGEFVGVVASTNVAVLIQACLEPVGMRS
jgi:hypothetical protein